MRNRSIKRKRNTRARNTRTRRHRGGDPEAAQVGPVAPVAPCGWFSRLMGRCRAPAPAPAVAPAGPPAGPPGVGGRKKRK